MLAHRKTRLHWIRELIKTIVSITIVIVCVEAWALGVYLLEMGIIKLKIKMYVNKSLLFANYKKGRMICYLFVIK